LLRHYKKVAPCLGKQVQELRKKLLSSAVRTLSAASVRHGSERVQVTDQASAPEIDDKIQAVEPMHHHFVIICCFLGQE